MEENIKNVVSKEELINILFYRNMKVLNENYKFIKALMHDKEIPEINKQDISNSIDEIVQYEEKNDLLCSNRDIYTHSMTLDVQYFKVSENKYICIYTYSRENIIDDAKKVIKQIDFILDNNLNEGKMTKALEYMKNEYKSPMDTNIKMKKPIEEVVKDEFKNYDYIKILECNKENFEEIDLKNLLICKSFLLYNEGNNFLTTDEQIILRLIILLGIVNSYFYYSDYYKALYESEINKVIEEANNYINFIKNNMSKVENKILYSKENKYRFSLYSYLNIKNDNKNFYYDIKTISISKYCTENFAQLSNIVQCILFDYEISKNNYTDAKKVYECNLPIFESFNFNLNEKGELESSPKEIAHAIVYIMLDEMRILEYQKPIRTFTSYENDENFLNPNEVTIDFLSHSEINAFTKRNIKIILKFYIDLYYYFRHFMEYKKAEAIYEILLYFKNGFGIDNFFIQYNFIKMTEEINNAKVNNDNPEEIEAAINSIEKIISEKDSVNKFDIDEVEQRYPNIKFSNFYENEEKVKRYIATGDKIMQMFGEDNIVGYDFSSAVIEWCKAVELEIAQKLIKPISNLEAKKNIENKANNNKINTETIKKSGQFRLETDYPTIGQFNAFEKYHIRDFIYDEYYSQIYKLDKRTYYNLCELLMSIASNRNDSAHKDKAIELSKANECKEEILASKKILEILSTLEEKIL